MQLLLPNGEFHRQLGHRGQRRILRSRASGGKQGCARNHTGIEDAHLLRDAAPQQLIEQVYIDIAEFVSKIGH